MGTKWAEVICDFAMVEISDHRLSGEMAANPALFFRKMALYMKNGIPRFNRPAEQRTWLRYTAPAYDSFVYTADGTDAETVETGKIGFELFSAEVITVDKFRNPASTPLDGCRYDAGSGNVTLPPGLEMGTRVSFDFYTDGEFQRDLCDEEKRILGLCVQLVWERRYAGDWLGRVSKVQDKTFSIGNEANKERADTDRLRHLESVLNQEMTRYAQNLAYRNAIPENQRFSPL